MLLRCFMFRVRVRTVCFQQWQYYPPPPASWVCLFSHRELLYLCVLFFIFLYGYLLHYVVYNTVVCINTIIYFSMGQKKNQWQITTSLEKSDSGILKYVFGTNEVMFFLGKKRNSHPASLKIGTCDLCIHSHVSLVFFPLSNMKLLNFWKLIVCLIAWVCSVVLKDDP